MKGAIDNVDFSKFDGKKKKKKRLWYVVDVFEVVERNCTLAGCVGNLSNCRVALICDVDCLFVESLTT